MPKRKSISDAEKCREALPKLTMARICTGAAVECIVIEQVGECVHNIDEAIKNLKLARKALNQ